MLTNTQAPLSSVCVCFLCWLPGVACSYPFILYSTLTSELWTYFREIYKDVVATEKEIARQEAEEIAKKEEAERQKFVDVKAAEVCRAF